jgi:hypothetical protein
MGFKGSATCHLQPVVFPPPHHPRSSAQLQPATCDLRLVTCSLLFIDFLDEIRYFTPSKYQVFPAGYETIVIQVYPEMIAHAEVIAQ